MTADIDADCEGADVIEGLPKTGWQ